MKNLLENITEIKYFAPLLLIILLAIIVNIKWLIFSWYMMYMIGVLYFIFRNGKRKEKD